MHDRRSAWAYLAVAATVVVVIGVLIGVVGVLRGPIVSAASAGETAATTTPARGAPDIGQQAPGDQPTAAARSGSVAIPGGASYPVESLAPSGAPSTQSEVTTSDPATSKPAISETTVPTTPPDSDEQTTPAQAPKQINPEPDPSPSHIRSAVSAAVADAAHQGIRQSVMVLNRDSGDVLAKDDADAVMPAESIAKLLFAIDEIRAVGGGENLTQQQLGDMDMMISQSDDTIASRYYGSHGEGKIVTRIADRYHLTSTKPSPKPRYWGDIKTTAHDIASLLHQVLPDPAIGPYLAAPMKQAAAVAADGYNQEFGMNAVTAAGSKQGWGCCLAGVVAIHTAGFTDNDIVVVLTTAAPDAGGLNVPQVSAFEHDPGFMASVLAITDTVRAVVDPDG